MRNLETFKVIARTIKRETNARRMLVNDERVNSVDACGSRNEDAGEDGRESGQSAA